MVKAHVPDRSSRSAGHAVPTHDQQTTKTLAAQTRCHQSRFAVPFTVCSSTKNLCLDNNLFTFRLLVLLSLGRSPGRIPKTKVVGYHGSPGNKMGPRCGRSATLTRSFSEVRRFASRGASVPAWFY